jgi:AsmA family protein
MDRPVTTPQPGIGGRTRRRERIVRWVLILLVAVPLLLWGLLFMTKGRFLKGPFETIASRMTGRQISVGGDFQLYFAPFDLRVLAEDLSLANPPWATDPHLLTAERIDARVVPLSLVVGDTRLSRLELVGARAALEWDAARRTNSWTFDGGGEPLAIPAIASAAVRDSRVVYRDPQLALLASIDFNPIAVTTSGIEDAVRFTGRGRLRETPFTLRGALLSPNATLAGGHNRLELTASTAHDQLDISGRLPSLAAIEGVPLAVAARGRNAAELFRVIGIVIPDTRSYRLDAKLVKQGSRYRFDDLEGLFGESDIAGRFTLETGGARRHVDADLSTRTLDIVDVAPFIGYNPDLVAARGFQAAAAATGAAPRRLLPDASLRAEGLRLFDADVRYRVRTLRSDSMPVTDIALTVGLDDGLLKLAPLDFTMARGRVSATIGIDWRRQPARTSYDVRLGETPLSVLLKGWGVEEAGTTGKVRGRIKLVGDGDTLHASLATASGRIAFVIPRGTFWTRNVQLAELDIGTFVQKMFEGRLKEPVQINCGLVAFTVRRGVAGADPILIDTAKNVILGRGGFSFVDEGLNLNLRADAKKFSLLSAQSPVGVRGTFANPALEVISPELLGRGGAALGLGVLVPPAAILAFVDVGDAKSTACGPVLAGKGATAQRTIDGASRDDVGSGKAPAKERKKFLGIF